MKDAAKKQTIILASGGTGGHVFPARALAGELIARGYDVVLMTDERGDRYETLFPGVRIEQVPSASPSVGGIFGKLRAGFVISTGIVKAWARMSRLRPAAVVGFGGYPSLPPVAAGRLAGVPVLLHEQNAVLGRVNRLLARWANTVAVSFEKTIGGSTEVTGRMVLTGNPVRAEIMALSGQGYQAPKEGEDLSLLVLGGSQGATILSDIFPAAIAALPEAMQERLVITQQCRAEDLDRVRDVYAETRARTVLATFFDDVPGLLAGCHLAVTRSGASTLAELSVAGRPAILVPFKYAMDNHQQKNAENQVDKGAAELILQDEFTVERVAEDLTRLLAQPERLAAMAEAAAGSGQGNAAAKLADLVETSLKNRNTKPCVTGKVAA
ncbi:undecaprenyldiphospho-muramoylpentapeptide beta-N-acetylglucosaminyltransferase [Sneathiella chinensis]|uniref:UDP-N-acetylglucosamine--N-acetylmuramyl-(pentapeptide) pyrophosphoryl-undecaprenol N-acetylglucosamine transferase n=1 Tax=Sneathiella chinensis TaxID=349750 RepID=A0ABQ5U1H7_9PROT|nr:undecaprenyldiphospho-muramoylpentapeptide beta-N-acetylglucosaminyltransferase [Sneathiella chinensis]GLQ06004.1 UDP-N-acetylglucosamine--N-acetylmuramyl-(pentapeptide) pyrophosphoryl-undecaprenol N-acetylglucosamine transferase [Sneathiella chinensis]